MYDGFEVTDREAQRSFKDLKTTYLAPCIRAIAQKIDLIVQGEKYQSYQNTGGMLGTAVDYNALVDLYTAQTNNNVPLDGRHLAINPTMAGALLKENKLTLHSSLGDGSRLINGRIGSGAGYLDIAQSTSIPTITNSDVVTGAINNASGEPAGDTSLIVDGLSAAIAAGTWIKIGGVPYRVVSTTGGGTPTVIVIESPGLRDAVANDAVITIMKPPLVNKAAGYAAGYLSTIEYDGHTLHPRVGQGVSFGASGNPYGIIAVDTTNKTIELNRALDAALVDDQAIFLIPGGKYGWGMNENGVTIISRPLALPQSGTVDSAIVSYGGFALRVVISYNRDYFKHQVTVDTLLGVLTLDADWNALLLG